jgi:rhodanese-related sulfurtransferase
MLDPAELQALRARQPELVVVDARRFEEYGVMNIPGSVSVPGAELVLRAPGLALSKATPVVVNCAGRTRSIIGAQSLINAGVENPVFALRNGTIGWTLAGLDLERDQRRRAPEAEPERQETARQRARGVAYRAGVRRLDWAAAKALGADAGRTLYRFDVRTPEEYAAGHMPGFRSAPGGQLVQEIDHFAPVRGARILLADDVGPRADMTASWLVQMAWEVYVLDGGFDPPLVAGDWSPEMPPTPGVTYVAADALARSIDRGNAPLIVDLAASPEHRRGHIPGARFALRAQLNRLLAELAPPQVVLTSPCGRLAAFAGAELQADHRIEVLSGGTAAWRAAGLSLKSGLTDPLSPPVDVYKRPYEGVDNSADAMKAYIDWELGLVEQLERDASHGFYVL